jgi:hypothetical protein
MKSAAVFLLAAALPATARPATIAVTITGTTGEIKVGEGPIFGHSSYQKILPGDPFVLTYTFDDERGKQVISGADGDTITQSEIESTALSSPGTNAVLQIGSAVWEFGASTRSQVTLKTSAGNKSEQFVFTTQAGSNRVSSQIVPAKGGYWPKNGDWRSSFTSTSLEGSTASFSADNDRVSASGSLIPSTITVTGVDLDGQWLREATTAGGPGLSNWERGWQLAHASPKGGYIVEEVSRTILGTRPDGSPITPSSIKYWQAWQVPAGSNVPGNALDSFANPAPMGSTGEDTVSAVARFYEGLILPAAFAVGKSPYAGTRLSSTIDPKLSTGNATLPVVANVTLHF